jgi:hypothetical protein
LPPSADHTIPAVVKRVTDPEVPKLIKGIYNIPAPATPRNDLVEIFLTGVCKKCGPIKADLNSQMLNKDANAKKFVPAEELRLNTAVPPAATANRLGVLANDLAGFPNGRRLTDDVVDIELQSLEGAAQTGKIVQPLAGGDGVNTAANAFGTSFPYVALPNDGSVNEASNPRTATPAPVAKSTHTKTSTGWAVGAGVLGLVVGGLGVLMFRRQRT